MYKADAAIGKTVDIGDRGIPALVNKAGIYSPLLVDTDGYLYTSNIQNVSVDFANSSTANLTASNSYLFTGTSSSTFGIAGIQVSLKTDQNATVYIEQSPDGSNWDISDVYNYYASLNNFGITVQAINSWVRVRVSTVSLTTTYFRLQTALCLIVEAVPRSLDENGYFKTAVEHIGDDYGFQVENTPIGEMRTVIPTRLVGAQFEGTTIDPNFWTATTANLATISQANAEITLASGTSSNGSAQLNSIRRSRYVSANAMRFRGVLQTGDSGTANNIRKWGVAYGAAIPTITDGAYFQLSGTTFSVVLLKGSSATTINTGSFNGRLGATYNPGTSVVTYEIYWTNSKVWFVIGDQLLHTFSASTTTWANTVNQYIYMSNINSGNSTSVTLKCRVASISRLGPLITQPISKYQAGATTANVCKYGPGNLHGAIISGVVNSSIVNLYDNTTNTAPLIWSSGTMGAQTIPFSLDFQDIPFFNGLTIEIQGANSNIMVAYE